MTPAEYAAHAEPFEEVATGLLDDGAEELAEFMLMVADELHEDADRGGTGACGMSVTRLPCPTCSGPSRETVGMVCQTCGTDYGPPDDPVAFVCGGVSMSDDDRAALADIARAAIRHEERRRAALTLEERAAEDAHRERGRQRLAAIRRRAWGDQ